LDVAIGTTGIAGADWTDHVRARGKTLHERFRQQIEGIGSFIGRADFVVIEGAAFAKARLQGMDQLSAMRWMVRQLLWERGIPYAVVPPNSRIIYATGKARWAGETPLQVKGRVRTAVVERYGVECEGPSRYDRADAFVLAAMGLDHFGWPLVEVEPTHRRALAGVEWPDALAATG
jgi:hypothetical protein